MPPSTHALNMDEVLREITKIANAEFGEEETKIIQEIEDMNDPDGADWYQSESGDDNFQEYLRLQDMAEMARDMDEWEYNEAANEYFANGGKPVAYLA